jgi:hypothetical protein
MIPENQNHTDNPTNTIENQNLKKYFLIVLIFGVKVTAEKSNKN